MSDNIDMSLSDKENVFNSTIHDVAIEMSC